MKFVKILFVFVLFVGIVVVLDQPITQMPPLGKWLNPFTGLWTNADHIDYTEKTKVFDFQVEGEVVMDSILIPHIYADNNVDLFFLQGYVTAEHRLFQMDYLARYADGRLAEILGDNMLAKDIEMRRLGLEKKAQTSFRLLSGEEDFRAYLEAYVRGVNTRIEELTPASLPIEYKLLGIQPETWSIEKVFLINSLLASQEINEGRDFDLAKLYQVLGVEKFDLLFPSMSDDTLAVVSNYNNQSLLDVPEIPVAPDSNTFQLNQDFPTVTNQEQKVFGASWAVGFGKTDSLYTVLSSALNFDLSMPTFLYANHLQSEEVNVMGYSVPGIPFVLNGFNDSLSWSFNPLNVNRTQWFSIHFQEGNTQKYLLDDEWKEIEMVVDSFVVKGHLNVVYDTVRKTVWGDIVYQQDSTAWSKRWVGAGASTELLALYNLNKVHNIAQAKEAVEGFNSAAVSFVFAAANGSIASAIQGKFPLIWQNQGRLPMDGRYTHNDTQAFLAADLLPFQQNPECGYVLSTNQKAVNQSYPFDIGEVNTDPSLHHFGLGNWLTALDSFSITALVIKDTYINGLASLSLPSMCLAVGRRDTLLDNKQYELLTKLRKWDFHPTSDGVLDALYQKWWTLLKRSVWQESVFEETMLPSDQVLVNLLTTKMRRKQFDLYVLQDDLPPLSELVINSFLEATKSYSVEKAVVVPIDHLLDIATFSKEVSLKNKNEKPLGAKMMVQYGENGVEAYGLLPGGQSGNPGSLYYDNLFGGWKKEQYFPLWFVESPREFGAGQMLYIMHVKGK